MKPMPVRRAPLLALLGAMLLSLSLASLANEPPHTTRMQGQILDVDGASVVLCIGTAHGAAVGQVLDVVRHVRQTRAPKAVGAPFRREAVGSIRIDEIFDDHYSRAAVVSGSPRVNDTAELVVAE